MFYTLVHLCIDDRKFDIDTVTIFYLKTVVAMEQDLQETKIFLQAKGAIILPEIQKRGINLNCK